MIILNTVDHIMSRRYNKSTINSESIKRPKNSFMFFAQVYRPFFSKQHPTLDNASISKLLGQEWFKLPSKDRQYFVDLAEIENREHRLKYPQYKYRPKPAIKKIKSLNSTPSSSPTQEMPFMGYFENTPVQKFSSDRIFDTFSHSNNTTDTEEEDDFDRLQKYYKNISFESVTQDALLSEYYDHSILEEPYEHNAFPTVYIPSDSSEECLDSDEFIQL